MRVLVTRPMPDAETTAEDLRRRGYEPIIAPMLQTVFRDWPGDFTGDRPDALIATSLNGIRGLARAPMLQDWLSRPLYVPGETSATYGRKVGFADVRPVRGDATAIGERVMVEMPQGSRILYVAGADRSGGLDVRLQASGYRVDLVEIYRAEPAERLPEETIAAFRVGEIDRILVFSARTAGALVSCLRSSDLLPVSRSIHIHAISQQAASPLIDAGFLSIVVAGRPDAAEMLDTLEAAQSSASNAKDDPEGEVHGNQRRDHGVD